MKKLLSFSFALLLCVSAFAQNNKLNKVASGMVGEMCDCFNKYGIKKLSPTAQKGIDKMVKANVASEADMKATLSEKELEALAQELTSLGADGSDFDKCADAATSDSNMAKYAGDMASLMADYNGDEEAFQKDFQAEMVRVMQGTKSCKTFYFFFLLGMQSSESGD